MEFNATFFVSALSFIIFTFIMNAIFYKPLTKIIDERENYINRAVNDAQNSEELANKLLKDKEATLVKTAEETRKIISSSTAEANAKGNELTGEAKRQAEKSVEAAKENLYRETEHAQNELKVRVKELAENIASKVLKEETHIENVNNELIDRILV